jgi:hypothetical protein
VESEKGGTEGDVARRIEKSKWCICSTVCGETAAYQKELKYEYSIQM